MLLGAGASFDAGLNTTSGLARDLVAHINSKDTQTRPGVAEALNFVYGEMVAHRGRHGGSPLEAVNTERLISAVRLLAGRDQHEADPFVASWKTAPGVFDATASAGINAVRIALDNHGSFDGGIDANKLAWAIREVVSERHDQVFEELEEALLKAVSTVLSAHGDVSYLRPLIELAHKQDGVDIATLNYDLTVEAAAHDMSVPVHRGVETWGPGSPMQFSSERGHVNLFKLHGSLDWEDVSVDQQRREWYEKHEYLGHYPVVAGRAVRVSGTGPVDRPAIIIGDREKLNGEGPTLSLLAAFEKALSRTTHLVVVGYSFADVHVNALVKAWANAGEDRTLTVIDPGWPERLELTGFRSDLMNALRPMRHISSGTPPRMEVLKARTKDILPVALAGLTPRPERPAELALVPVDDGMQLCLTNTYSALARVHISAPFPTPKTPNPPRTQLGHPASERSASREVEHMPAGEVQEIEVRSEVGPDEMVPFQVFAEDHQDSWNYEVSLAWPGARRVDDFETSTVISSDE